MRGCSHALRLLFGSCTHASHLTVAAHGPGLFEGPRDRLPRLALIRLYECRRDHDLGHMATPKALAPILTSVFSPGRIVWVPCGAPFAEITNGAPAAPPNN